MLFRDTAAGPDHLERDRALGTLLSTIHHLHPPGCVALYGSWGSGKTNLMRALQTTWEGLGGRTVWFDPWEHERSGDVVSPLLHALVADAKKRDGVDYDAVKDAAFKVARVLGGLAVRLAGGYFGLTQFSTSPASGLKDISSEDFKALFEAQAKYEDEVREIKQDFRKLQTAASQKLVRQCDQHPTSVGGGPRSSPTAAPRGGVPRKRAS